jgi:type IV pilus secretin PilQ/predicted competence protein
MRCAIRPLSCLIGLALFVLAPSPATPTEVADEGPLEMTGETTNPGDTTLEDTTEEPGAGAANTKLEEDLLGEAFDEQAEPIALEDGRVNFALQGANVRDFCNWFAERLEINIVLSPKVDGPMNITLRDVPWEIALRKALETHGYVLTIDENGIYTVLTEEEVALEPLKTVIYTLSYASAQKAAEIITPLLTKDRGIVQYDTDSNQLIVSDVPAKLADIERVIGKLDRQIAQVSIEVKLVEKTSTDGSDLGIKWSSLEAYQVGASDIARGYQHTKTRTDRDLIYTSEAWSQHLEPTRGVEVRDIAGTRVGGDPDLAIPLEEVIKTTTKTLILSATDFNLLFSALLREDNTELISCPKVATVDNRAAEIKVVRRLPIPNYTYNEETGSYEISAFDYEEVGIKLMITPQVNEDDYITLDVQPELSSQYDDQVFVISGSEVTIPIIDKRAASTRVIVKSTETLVIGGLTSTDETTSIARVPLLSNIPIVGNLFKHKSTEKVKTDLLIFITPTIVSGVNNETASEISDERIGTRVAEGAAEETPTTSSAPPGGLH